MPDPTDAAPAPPNARCVRCDLVVPAVCRPAFRSKHLDLAAEYAMPVGWAEVVFCTNLGVTLAYCPRCVPIIERLLREKVLPETPDDG